MKNEQDFLDFQKYFTEYQKRFGLTGYRVYFKYERIENAFADTTVNNSDMVVTIRLNSKLPAKDKPFWNVKRSAKHEALHLLIDKLTELANARFLNKEQIYGATEEIVFKLEELIGD